MIRAGRTLFLTKDSHLWIVISEPDDAGRVLIVNLTTKRTTSDATVVLVPGDHPYVKHDTAVAFAYARLAKVDTLEALVNEGPGSFHADIPPALLMRIQQGLLVSPHTPNWIKAYFVG